MGRETRTHQLDRAVCSSAGTSDSASSNGCVPLGEVQEEDEDDDEKDEETAWVMLGL